MPVLAVVALDQFALGVQKKHSQRLEHVVDNVFAVAEKRVAGDDVLELVSDHLKADARRQHLQEGLQHVLVVEVELLLNRSVAHVLLKTLGQIQVNHHRVVFSHTILELDVLSI